MNLSKPQGDLRSLAWKARTKAARRLLAGSPGEYQADDFDWNRYHLEYADQLAAIESSFTLRLQDGQAEMRSGQLFLKHGLPLHPNHQVLYEHIVSLEPASVLEAGCGAGDHLNNLALLLPGAEIRGIDRSAGQLQHLRQRNPELAEMAMTVDLTLPHPSDLEKADVTFAQAVLMHIQTGNGHRVALWNLFDLAREQVVLMENLDRHALVADIIRLWSGRILPWPDLHLYQAESGPPVIIASREPIRTPLSEVQLPTR